MSVPAARHKNSSAHHLPCIHVLAQELRGATQLEVLHWCPFSPPTLRDWDLLSSLRPLQRLCIIADLENAVERDSGVLRSMVRRSMPGLLEEQITGYDFEGYASDFAATAGLLEH